MNAAARSTIQLADAKGIVHHGAEWLVIWSDPESLKSSAEFAAERRAAEHRAEYERHIAAALRGIAGIPALRVTSAGETVSVEGHVCTLPALPLDPRPIDLDVARGRAMPWRSRYGTTILKHTRGLPHWARARAPG